MTRKVAISNELFPLDSKHCTERNGRPTCSEDQAVMVMASVGCHSSKLKVSFGKTKRDPVSMKGGVKKNYISCQRLTELNQCVAEPDAYVT